MKEKKRAYDRIKGEFEKYLQRIYGVERIPVFGEGNLAASIVLVGEAPGEQETLKQRPFVGSAGKNLDKFLQVLELPREAIYITNVVKFRPYKINPKSGRTVNRPPTREEILLCKSFLQQELDLVRPQVVVTLGNVALKALCADPKMTIGQCHGRPLAVPGAVYRLFPLYHPASVIYNRQLMATYEQDLVALKLYMERPAAFPTT